MQISKMKDKLNLKNLFKIRLPIALIKKIKNKKFIIAFNISLL
jgi:hypothetical protein